MEFEPLRDRLLCEKVVSEKEKTIEFGLQFNKEQLPLYKILKIGKGVENESLKEGDIISTNSEPTPLDKDRKLYLVTEKYVAAVVD